MHVPLQPQAAFEGDRFSQRLAAAALARIAAVAAGLLTEWPLTLC